MDNCEKFNETSLPKKDQFYGHLNMGDITDADYAHAKRVCKGVKIRHSGDYLYLYYQKDTILLADVFENFQNICLDIYELDLAHFIWEPGLAW